jgi:hypothetical protein
MLKFILVLVFVLFGAGCFKFSAQNLTISSSGQTGTSGTNWSISSNTLTVTGTADIRASVIVNALANGNLSVVGNSTNFAVTVSEAISSITVGSSLTIGSMTNAGAITINVDLSLAGGIAAMGGDVQLNGNITSTATGDMFFQGLGDAWSIRLATGKTIEKTAGTGLLTMQGNGRINNSTSAGSILASGSAMLNVVIINELNSGTAGLYNVSTGNITTNGGHLWIGAGAKTRVWNGFSVGSTGVPGNANYNGIDVTGNISTSGGDILLWAFVGSNARSAGYGDITALSTNRTISSGSGDITLMTRYNDFVNSTPDININTSGKLTLAPASGASFDVALAFSGSTTTGTFTGSSGMGGLIIQNFTSVNELIIGTYNGTGVFGDTPYTSTNTSDITLGAAISIDGPITVYGGDITVSQNLTSTLSSADILLHAYGAINLSANMTIQTNGGDVTFEAAAGGIASSALSAIYLNSGSQILTFGGNITLGGGYSGTEGNLYAATNIAGGGFAVRLSSATLTAAGGHIKIYGRNVSFYGDGVFLSAVNISTTGSGTIGIYGDSYGGFNNTFFFGGITFDYNASTIQTVNGNITLKGILTQSQSTQGYGINFYRTTGFAGETRHINILSQAGAIQITGDRGSSIGGGIGHSSWGNVYFGSPADNSFTASGNVVFTYSGFVNAGYHGFKVKTTGAVTYEPVGSSFISAQTLPANSYGTLADSASSLTIGKAGNTANLTMNSPQTVTGPITAYGGTITLNANLTTTNNGNISLYSDNAIGGLSVQRNVTASGAFNYIPQSNSFAAAVTYPISNLNVSCTGLLIGKTSNTSSVTFGNTTSINGPITVYGGSVNMNENLNSSSGGTISLFGNSITFGPNKTVTSSGQLIVAPQDASNTIGIAGASGTLALPASYFSSNFTNGFSNIQIGSNTQTGNISSNAFTLLDNMKILTSGSLTLGGKPVLGINNLTLGSNISTINVGSPANYFQTTGSGKVVREISSGTSRLLPVGNLYYNPLTVLNNTGSADVFSARVLDSVCLNGLAGPVVTTPHVKVTWDIDKVNLNTVSGIDMEFGWDATQEIGYINGYKVNHHNGTSWSFAAGTSNTPVGTAYKTLTHSGYTGTFSPFAIMESSFPLPVTLINLSVSCESSKVELSWQTASEWHSDYFQVEFSIDGTEWLALEKVTAAGNSTSLQQYTYSDLTPSRLMSYYRLKQVDINGQYEIYGPIASECIVDGMDFTIYPNPSSTSATIQLLNTKKETAEIKLLDISGKEFWSQELELVNGTTSMVLSTENLAPGIYIIVLSSKDGILTNKLVVE